MKNIYSLLLASACIAAPVAVFASGGSCTTPSTVLQSGATPSDAGNTCTDTSASNYVSAFCGGGQVTAGQPQEIYTITLAAAGPARTATSLTLTGGSATFTPTLYLYTGTCANGGGCVQTGTVAVPMDLTTVAAGTYLLAIGGSQLDPNDATACGAYTINANGTLPVKLQKFSVK